MIFQILAMFFSSSLKQWLQQKIRVFRRSIKAPKFKKSHIIPLVMRMLRCTWPNLHAFFMNVWYVNCSTKFLKHTVAQNTALSGSDSRVPCTHDIACEVIENASCLFQEQKHKINRLIYFSVALIKQCIDVNILNIWT